MKLQQLAGPFLAFGLAVSAPLQEVQAGKPESAITSLREPANDIERRAGIPIESADVFKLKLLAKDIDSYDDKIKLGDDIYLQIENDGKMRFINAGFEGYVVLTYSKSFVVYDNSNKVLVVMSDDGLITSAQYQKGLSENQMSIAKKAAELLCNSK